MMRRLRPDRNPLWRTADRVEAAVVASLLVVFLAGVSASRPGRRRLDAWDAEWSRTGPQWTGRL